MRQAENRVKIEGILAETDLKYGSYLKNGENVETIGGMIKVLVKQEINGTPVELEIPVYMFSGKYTKAGKLNPSYESIERVMKDFVSIAAAGNEKDADKIRITSGTIKMNEFIGQNNQIVSQPRINASFITKVTGDFNPEASFCLEFLVSNMNRETDADGVELDPPRLNVEVIVPQYTSPDAAAPNVDVITLKAISPSVINAVESYWESGNTYRASGRLNFSAKTEEYMEEVDFGEAMRKVRTISVSEFIITGGSQAPLEGDFAFDIDEIKAGIAARKTRLEDAKSGKTATNKKTPAPTSNKGKLDLGF